MRMHLKVKGKKEVQKSEIEEEKGEERQDFESLSKDAVRRKSKS